MRQEIKERFDDNKLRNITKLYSTSLEQIKILDGFESFIYEVSGQEIILRVSHSLRRTPDSIRGEVDWLNYLADGDARVAQALPSTIGNLIEVIDDGHGDYFLATAFAKAQGDHLPQEKWTSNFIQHYGETIGRIHRLSRNYEPSNPAWRRFVWNDKIYIDLDEWATITEPAIMDRATPLMERLSALPHDETYHMIHQDAHGGNFYVDDDGHITLFDFDDCGYGHEIYDIAMVIFYSRVHNRPDIAEQFTTDFLTGYIRENTFDPRWLAYITDFMTLREIDLYALIERDVDWRNGEDPWAAMFMQGRRERLINQTPIVEFDFTTLSHVIDKK